MQSQMLISKSLEIQAHDELHGVHTPDGMQSQMLISKSLEIQAHDELHGVHTPDEWEDTDDRPIDDLPIEVIPVAPKPRQKGQQNKIPECYLKKEKFHIRRFNHELRKMKSSLGIDGSVELGGKTIIYRNDDRPEATKSIYIEIPADMDLKDVDYFYLRLVNLNDIDKVFQFPPLNDKEIKGYKNNLRLAANGGIIVHKKNLFVDGDGRKIAIARSRTKYKAQLSFQLSSNNKDANNQEAIFTICFVPLKNADYMFNDAVRTKDFTIMIQSPGIKKQVSESRPAKLNSEARINAENALIFDAKQYQQKSNAMKGRIQYLKDQIKQCARKQQ
jgi:hypothetical protein